MKLADWRHRRGTGKNSGDYLACVLGLVYLCGCTRRHEGTDPLGTTKGQRYEHCYSRAKKHAPSNRCDDHDRDAGDRRSSTRTASAAWAGYPNPDSPRPPSQQRTGYGFRSPVRHGHKRRRRQRPSRYQYCPPQLRDTRQLWRSRWRQYHRRQQRRRYRHNRVTRHREAPPREGPGLVPGPSIL